MNTSSDRGTMSQKQRRRRVTARRQTKDANSATKSKRRTLKRSDSEIAAEVASRQSAFLLENPQVDFIQKTISWDRKRSRRKRVADDIASRITTDSLPQINGNNNNIHPSKPMHMNQKNFQEYSSNNIPAERNQKRRVEKSEQVNAGIYMIRNIKTGHAFFGSSWDLRNAKSQAVKELQDETHEHQALIRTMKVYGVRDIRFQTLERIPVDGNEFNFREFEELLSSRLTFHKERFIKRQAHKILTSWRVTREQLYWPRWKAVVAHLQQEEFNAAAIEIQRTIYRGRKGRKRARVYKRYYAARKIQARVRGRLARGKVSRLRLHNLHNSSALIIQRTWAYYLSVRVMLKRRRMARMMTSAATIQRIWFGYLGRKAANARKVQVSQNNAAIEIQRIARGYISKTFVAQRRQLFLEFYATIDIQRLVRGRLGRRRAETARAVKLQLIKQNKAALLIQDAYRYHLGLKLQYTVNQYELELKSATVLRVAWKKYLRRKLRWNFNQFQLATASAKLIQRTYRLYFIRRTVTLQLAKLRETLAATTIQRYVRGFWGRKIGAELRHERLRLCSAISIQKCYRAFRTRKIMYLARLHKLHSKMAVRIQTSYRRHVSFRRYKTLVKTFREERAALVIQCHIRIYFAKKILRKKQYVMKNGPCEECRGELAQCYSSYFHLELCHACLTNIVQIENDLRDDEDEITTTFIPIQEYRMQLASACKIQRAYRRKQIRHLKTYGACSECSKPKKLYCYECNIRLCYSCSHVLHSHSAFRAHNVVNNVRFTAHTKSAIVIQKYARRYLYQDSAARLLLIKKHAAASYIQQAWKYRYGRYTRFVKKKAAEARATFENEAATTIQRWTRGWITRSLVARRIQHNAAALVIQCAIRRYIARKEVYRRTEERLFEIRTAAAIVIQSHVRKTLARKKFIELIKQKTQSGAARVIQCSYRSKVARKELARLIHERNERLRLAALSIAQQHTEKAARVITNTFKTFVKARKKLRAMRAYATQRRKMEQQSCEALEERCAEVIQQAFQRRLQYLAPKVITIQCAIRRYLSVCCLERLKLEAALLQEKTRAAVSIQSLYRARNARRKVAVLRQEWEAAAAAAVASENTVWTKYWDDANECYYYYHNETGESSWEVPEDFVEEMQDDDEQGNEWVECWDEESETTYYYNNVTGESSWENPTAAVVYDDTNYYYDEEDTFYDAQQ